MVSLPKQFRFLVLGLMAFCLVLPSLGGSDGIDPKAKEIVEKSILFLKATKSYQVENDSIVKLNLQGLNQNITTKSSLTFEQPNKLAIHSSNPMFNLDIISDGTNVFMYSPQMKKYTEDVAPATAEELYKLIISKSTASSPMNNTQSSLMLLFNQDVQKIWEVITKATFAGEEEIDGTKTNHVQLWMDENKVDAWYQEGDQPVIYKTAPDMAKLLQSMGLPAMEGVKVSLNVYYKNWEFNPELPESTFVFTPPKDARKVDALFKNSEK